MTRLIEKQVSIVGGPDRYDLFAALALFYEGRVALFQIPRHPEKEDSSAHTVEVLILDIKAEDGSGRNWLFMGRLRIDGQQVHGFYSLRDRTGWIAPRDDR